MIDLYPFHSYRIRDNSGGIFPVEKSRIGKEWGKEHLTFVPLTKDNRLCAKEIIGNRANLTKWQDDFHAYMVEKYPDLERGESASKTGRKHIPTGFSSRRSISPNRQEPLKLRWTALPR